MWRKTSLSSNTTVILYVNSVSNVNKSLHVNANVNIKIMDESSKLYRYRAQYQRHLKRGSPDGSWRVGFLCYTTKPDESTLLFQHGELQSWWLSGAEARRPRKSCKKQKNPWARNRRTVWLEWYQNVLNYMHTMHC